MVHFELLFVKGVRPVSRFKKKKKVDVQLIQHHEKMIFKYKVP